MRRESHYFRAGLTAFLTVCAILLFYDTLFGHRVIVVFGGRLLNALNPILYGAIIAYLLAPVVDFLERKLFPSSVRQAKEQGKFCAAGPRAVSLILTWLLILILFYLLLIIVIPQLYKSLVLLFNSMETYYNTVNNWITNLLDTNTDAKNWVTQTIDSYYQDLNHLLTEKILPQAQQIMTAVSGGIATAVVFMKDLLVGLAVSVYLLATKEMCIAHARKLTYSIFSRQRTSWIFRGVRKVDSVFSGFVRGKLLDSLIIGILCFFFSQIFGFPYAPLISVIIGVTNIIPFFGPFLGAIPSLFLILLVDPLQALYFLIFIIALQQVDGNIIGPKILGDQIGLSSLWVIIAILVGGTFFGLPGMFFGVPVCACLYAFVKFLVETQLKRKSLPVPSNAYRTNVPNSSEEKQGNPGDQGGPGTPPAGK